MATFTVGFCLNLDVHFIRIGKALKAEISVSISCLPALYTGEKKSGYISGMTLSFKEMLQNMLARFSFVSFFSYFSNDCPLVEMWILLEVEIIISNHLM